MTRDELIDLATECGFSITHTSNMGVELYLSNPHDIAKLAERIKAAAFADGYEKGKKGFMEAVVLEREACAKVCEDKGFTWKSREDIAPENANKAYMASQFIASAIRARGQQ